MLTVHVRINDAATGKPTPVRLHISGPDHAYFAPFGRIAEFATGPGEDVGGGLYTGGESWCIIDGSCEVPLPSGVPLRIRATKGPEFDEIDTTVTLGHGQMALRFTITRRSNIRETGWFPGDTRAHFLSPHEAALEAAAEDLNIVNLLAHEHRFASPNGTAYLTVPNMLAFSGQQPALATDAALVAVNTLNTHPVLGSVGLLHSHRAVFPLSFGGEDATDDWSVCDWCDQCHRKNGLTIWVEPSGGEALLAAILGKIDAIEYDGRPRKPAFLPLYYRLLNAGFRLPIVGGSGKDSNRVPLGSPRTYAKLAPGEPLTYTNWINAVRAGRTFATTGPLLTLAVDDCEPGDTLELPDAKSVTVVATVVGAETLEILVNGEVAAQGPGRHELPITASGWIAARVSSPKFAHTSPVIVRVAGKPSTRRTEALRPLRKAVEQTREWVADHGRFADERRKRQLLEHCDDALNRLRPSEGDS